MCKELLGNEEVYLRDNSVDFVSNHWRQKIDVLNSPSTAMGVISWCFYIDFSFGNSFHILHHLVVQIFMFTFVIFSFRNKRKLFFLFWVFVNITGKHKINLRQTSSWSYAEPQWLIEKAKIDQLHLIIWDKRELKIKSNGQKASLESSVGPVVHPDPGVREWTVQICAEPWTFGKSLCYASNSISSQK